MVGLLFFGSKSSPQDDVLQIGEAGAKQLVQVKEEAEAGGLSAFLEKSKERSALSDGGLPRLPTGMSRE